MPFTRNTPQNINNTWTTGARCELLLRIAKNVLAVGKLSTLTSTCSLHSISKCNLANISHRNRVRYFTSFGSRQMYFSPIVLYNDVGFGNGFFVFFFLRSLFSFLLSYIDEIDLVLFFQDTISFIVNRWHTTVDSGYTGDKVSE
jgi:hypothetical protein